MKSSIARIALPALLATLGLACQQTAERHDASQSQTVTPASATVADTRPAIPMQSAMPDMPMSHKHAPIHVSADAPILDPDQFPNDVARDAYIKAREVPERLAKMYCYCHCHRELGHQSLLTCYQTDHAAECAVCQREAVQAWFDAKRGAPVEETQKAADMAYNNGQPPPHAE